MLYKKKYSIEEIAKIRSLGISTIFDHLIKWYLVGGEFDIDKYISPNDEKEVLLAISKSALPDSFANEISNVTKHKDAINNALWVFLKLIISLISLSIYSNQIINQP